MLYFDYNYNPPLFYSYEPLCNKQQNVEMYQEYEEKWSNPQ